MASDGVKACVEAFERLKAGKPHVAAHVGLDGTKITAGIVSFEAGFDRGYLKKKRPSHQALIAQIEAFRTSFGNLASSKTLQIKRANDKVVKARSELEVAQEQLYQVMTHNIQLVERVRLLEDQLKRLSNVKIMPKRE
ncbi:hypothetical protein QEL87_002733 [Pseudomonas putida]|nr:hypothetical protein [Pseudomonas putida]